MQANLGRPLRGGGGREWWNTAAGKETFFSKYDFHAKRGLQRSGTDQVYPYRAS